MKNFLLDVLTYEQWVKLAKSLLLAAVGACVAVLTQAATDGTLGPYGTIVVTALSTWVAGVLKTTLLDPVPLPAKVESNVRWAVDENLPVAAVNAAGQETHKLS